MDHETRRHRIRGGVRAIPHGGMFDCLFVTLYLMAVCLSVCLYLMAVCLSVCT